MKRMLIAAIAAIAAATPISAADIDGSFKDSLPRPAEISRIENTGFGGGYVGASVNWSSLDVDHSGSLDGRNCDECEHNDDRQFISGKLPGMSDDVVNGGMQIGYNFTAFERFYFGPVAKFDLGGPSASLRRTLIEGDEDGFGETNGKIEMDVNWTATLAAKLGIQVIDRVGIYGLIGVGFVDVDASGSVHMNLQPSPIGGISVNTPTHSETVTAFTYGAGVDVKLDERWRLFAEWQRFDLETFSANGSIFADCLKYGYDADPTLDVIRVGVNVAF